ncbi:hypothetical protein GPX89_29800 [Nocardia sp. ET3-3]|uniref:Uncharacterized protein n=1 Tax=Nocardia terrae TaxID=2675851 RepID=A0A7K1V451_9NOCA|nr:hypothetical protein [Nocardia terrae]MVU81423.1 hypothetical protein [Nocardia terrae]
MVSVRPRHARADQAAARLLTAIAVLFVVGSFAPLVDYADQSPQQHAMVAQIHWCAWEFTYNLPNDKASYRQLIGSVPAAGTAVSLVAATMLTPLGSGNQRVRTRPGAGRSRTL